MEKKLKKKKVRLKFKKKKKTNPAFLFPSSLGSPSSSSLATQLPRSLTSYSDNRSFSLPSAQQRHSFLSSYTATLPLTSLPSLLILATFPSSPHPPQSCYSIFAIPFVLYPLHLLLCPPLSLP
ncbi:hypothetical protein ACH5RR_018524 [Cinchona calisaya]|uniref:Uncharacterized protein n=1 Tax=Cinchona calisaya TaxID=153742 RepID=A0ABD2ZPT9_9GENT